jgi:hypothetical protein
MSNVETKFKDMSLDEKIAACGYVFIEESWIGYSRPGWLMTPEGEKVAGLHSHEVSNFLRDRHPEIADY